MLALGTEAACCWKQDNDSAQNGKNGYLDQELCPRKCQFSIGVAPATRKIVIDSNDVSDERPSGKAQRGEDVRDVGQIGQHDCHSDEERGCDQVALSDFDVDEA